MANEKKHLRNIPGSCGYPVVGDRSIEFYRNASAFVERHLQKNNSQIFISRLLNKCTVFVCENAAIKEILQDKHEYFDMGYKDYFYDIFGENILFKDGPDCEQMKKHMKELFTPNELMKYNSIIEDMSGIFLERLQCSPGLDIYQHLKKLVTFITLSVFLGIDPHSEKGFASFEELVSLTTAHWHGIISLPVGISLPGVSSGYKRAMDAKERLLSTVRDQCAAADEAARAGSGGGTARRGVVYSMRALDCFASKEDELARTLLVFISALIPKAAASLLTSFILSRPAWEHYVHESTGELSEENLEYKWLPVSRPKNVPKIVFTRRETPDTDDQPEALTSSSAENFVTVSTASVEESVASSREASLTTSKEYVTGRKDMSPSTSGEENLSSCRERSLTASGEGYWTASQGVDEEAVDKTTAQLTGLGGT